MNALRHAVKEPVYKSTPRYYLLVTTHRVFPGEHVWKKWTNRFEFWDLKTGLEVGSFDLDGEESGFGSVVFSPDGKTLATGGNGRVQLWDFGRPPGRADDGSED